MRFEGFIQSLGGYDVTRPYLPWLILLIKSKTIDYNRKYGRQAPNGGIISLDASDFECLGDNGDTYETLERLNQSLDRLPERQRQILLFSTLGYTQEEIAEKMRISVGTVKSQLHKARKQAKSEYEKLGGFIALALWRVYEAEAAQMPAHLSARILAQSANIAVPVTTVSIGAKIALLGTGAKAAIITVSSLALIAAVAVPLLINGQEPEAEAIQAMAVIQLQEEENAALLAQQQAEAAEQARIEAEAARIAEEQARAEAEAQRLEDERIAEEQAEAERLEAEEQARLEAEAEAQRLEAERIAAEQAQQQTQQAPPPAASSQAPEQPQQPAQTYTAPDVRSNFTVDVFYSSGKSRATVWSDINDILTRANEGGMLMERGWQSLDGANNFSGISVTGDGTSQFPFGIRIASWRREVTTVRPDVLESMKFTHLVMQYAYSSTQVGTSLFNMVDEIMTSPTLTDEQEQAIIQRHDFTEVAGNVSGQYILTHTNTGTRITYSVGDVLIFYF